MSMITGGSEKHTKAVMGSQRFNIAVTQDDIDAAMRCFRESCAVARAIARQIPDATHIIVDTQTVRFSVGQKRMAFLTPYVVQDYIVAFDAGDDIKPFRFHLRNPIVRERKPQRKQDGVASPNRATLVAVQTGTATDYRRIGGRFPPKVRVRVGPGRRTYVRKFGRRALRENQEDTSGERGARASRQEPLQ